jgi:PIN domain nuclease of toxin-antitoxin system
MTGLLLDTHVFIWWQQSAADLGDDARGAISDSSNRVFVSAISVFEIGIKAGKGKLIFGASPTEAITANGFHELPVRAAEAETAAGLDWDHRDPFDRLLVAQARHAALVLVTADEAIRHFGGAPQLWAGAGPAPK